MNRSLLKGPLELLEGFSTWFTDRTGVGTLLEPQLIENPEPTLRVAYKKTARDGKNRERMELVGTLAAYGEGPKTYLDSVIRASRKAALLFDEDGSYADKIEIASGGSDVTASVIITRLGDGEFMENEREGTQFPFLYAEQFFIRISYKTDLIEEEQ